MGISRPFGHREAGGDAGPESTGIAPATKEAIDGFKLQTGEDIEQGAKVSALFS